MPAGARALRSGLTRSKCHDVRRIAGRRMSLIDPAIFGRDQHDGVAVGQHGDVLRIGREGNAERAAAERAIRTKLDAVERAGRRDRHGAGRRLQASARQQPAGDQRFGERHGEREAPGGAQHRKAVGEARARATQLFRNPGERQSGVGERTPQRRLPVPPFAPSFARLMVWGSARSAKIRAATSATIWSLSPVTLPGSKPSHSLAAMVGPSGSIGKLTAKLRLCCACR